MSPQPKKLLWVSPQPEFLREHSSDLKAAFAVQVAATPEAAEFLCHQWEPEIVIFDFDVLGDHLRGLVHKFTAKTCFLAVSKMAAKELSALRSGADQFAVVPIEPALLHARIESLWKRLGRNRPVQVPGGGAQATSSEPMHIGELLVFPQDYLVKRQDQVVNVTPTQFKLLLTFASKRDQLLSRAWLKEFVWENADISLRSIDAQISKLKKMVPELDQYLVNIYGKGYVFSIPKSKSEAA